MRAIRIGLAGVLIVGLCGVIGIQEARGAAQQQMLGGMVLRLAALDKTVAWPATNISSGFLEMVEKKLESQRIAGGRRLQLQSPA